MTSLEKRLMEALIRQWSLKIFYSSQCVSYRDSIKRAKIEIAAEFPQFQPTKKRTEKKAKPDQDAVIMLALAEDFKQGRCNFMRNMLREERESMIRRFHKIAKRLEQQTQGEKS